ncbi:MAG TPA: Flp family type IVb pilin [Firmicutes bacterium]|nr:Flp family type IVb pilin [Bacillota bacterium]
MSVLTQLKRLLYDESGQGMVEYGLILALIALVVIGALSLFGDKIAEVFNKLRSEVEAELDPTP